MVSYIYTDTDGTISVNGLTQLPGGTAVIGANVTGTMFDWRGDAVQGWTALAMTADGTGNYLLAFAASTVPKAGQYRFKVTAVANGATLTIFQDVIVKELLA